MATWRIHPRNGTAPRVLRVPEDDPRRGRTSAAPAGVNMKNGRDSMQVTAVQKNNRPRLYPTIDIRVGEPALSAPVTSRPGTSCTDTTTAPERS